MQYTIYGLRCVCSWQCREKGVRYIGQTQRAPEARMVQHRSTAKTVKFPLYFWMRKHGIENIHMQVLARADSLDQLNQLERGAIFGDGATKKLLNMSLGGDGYTRIDPVTHCKHGHEYVDDNTYTAPNGKRQCRTCMNSIWGSRKAEGYGLCECGKVAVYKSAGKCNACYRRTLPERDYGECTCGNRATMKATMECRSCYQRRRRAQGCGQCVCGATAYHKTTMECRACYQRRRYAHRRSNHL